MWRSMLSAVILLFITSCASPTQTPLPTHTPCPTYTAYPTYTPFPTQTPIPTNTATVTLSFTPEPTSTPEGYPQIFFGIPEAAVGSPTCGGYVIWTMDHDKRDVYEQNYWEKYMELPKPDYSYRTRDGRRNMDICTWPGYSIVFLQEEGKITQIRFKDGSSQDTVLDILITKGIGVGFSLGYGHVNADIDLDTPGVQSLTVGTIVRKGDIIAHTGLGPIPDQGTPTNIGLLYPGFDDVYHPDQELMYIGPDGKLNILYEE